MNIALIGKIASGKSTVSDILVSRYLYKRLAFADALKEDLIVKFGIDPSDITTDNKHVYRQTLQNYGQEMRGIDPAYWIKRLHEKANVLYAMHQPVVIDDCRFVNESVYCLGAGFTTVKILRDDMARLQTIRSKHPEYTSEEFFRRGSNVSEVEQDSIIPDITLFNNGTLEDIVEQVISILGYEGKRFGE